MSKISFARLYHSQYADFDDDLVFWRYAASCAPGEILELGCGSGRVLLPIAAMGRNITGIDHDHNMLALLKQSIPASSLARIRLKQADMRTFSLNTCFGLVIIPCNLFAYLNEDDALTALVNIRRHLDPGGSLAMDMPNAPIILTGEDLDGEVLDTFYEQHSGDPVQVTADQVISSDLRHADVTWHYDVLHSDGCIERIEAHRRYHLRNAEDVCAAFQYAGFEEPRLYGGYRRQPYNTHSPRLLVFARSNRT
ncbi:MAG: class I SAM-dependent methyltransferase [Anaerolineales bacterium]|nr:class I SAM-dependent methyltransferase [Anaerolineales bacterium]